MQLRIAIGLASILTALISAETITHKGYAAGSDGASGVTTGAGSNVDRNLFCKTGVITPVCK